MRRSLIATLTMFLALGALTRAEIVEALRYWPNDGIRIHYNVDSTAWEVGIWVYCGFGCTEFSQLYSVPPFDATVQSPVSHNHYMDRPAWYAQIQHTWGESIYEGNAKAVWDCDDVRSDLNQEYVDPYSGGRVYDISGFLPNCDPWDGGWKQGGGSANFSWSELNGGFQEGNPHSPSGIVRAGLLNGLEATRTNYNRGGVRLSSGYRCPHGNASVGGALNSFHVHGRAADMYSFDHPWTEDEFNLLRQAAFNTGNTTELFNWNTYADRHLHAAW